MTINIADNYVHILEIPVLVFLLFFMLNDIFRRGTKIKLVNRNAFLFYLLLSVSFLISILLSSINAFSLGAVLKSFLKWLEIIIISLLVFYYVKDEKGFKGVYWVTFLSAMLTLIVLAIKMIGGDFDVILERQFPAYDSLYALVLILPITIYNKKLRFYIISLVLLLTSIVSLSRGVWIGIFVSLIFMYKHLRASSFFKFTAISIIVAVLAFMFVAPLDKMISGRFDEIISSTGVSNVERIALMNYAFIGFSGSPLFGIGALNFPQFIMKSGFTKGLVADDLTTLEPHNFFLQTLTEEGLIGFVIICCFFANIYIILFRNKRIKYYRKSILNMYILGLRMFFLCVMINLALGFVANEFRFIFALFLGLVLSLVKIDIDCLKSNSKEVH